MMQLNDYSDVRNLGFCIHCGEGIDGKNHSRDHVPTRALLDRPYPENLPVVGVCGKCNNGFSKDEEYLVSLIGSVLSGSTELDRDQFPVAAGILDHSEALGARIERTRRVQWTLWGDAEIQWSVELDRAANVVAKNARGHAFFELGEPLQSLPSYIGMSPVQLMFDQQRRQFERLPDGVLWAEVGSRMMQRMAIGDPEDGWVEVQNGVYRYTVIQLPGETLVRSVIREYLATEVSWCDATDD